MTTRNFFLTLLVTAVTFAIPTAHADTQSLIFRLKTARPAEKVVVATNVHHWETDHAGMEMNRVGPCEFLLTLPKPLAGHLEYKYVVDGQWQTDPENPNRVRNGVGSENSVFINSSIKEDPSLELQNGVPAWVRSTIMLRDSQGRNREITVLRPPAEFQKHSTVTVYFQDGGEYLEKANAANIIANLSSEPGMPAMTAVFIPPQERNLEYGHDDYLGRNAADYARFVATSVVPAVERKHDIRGSASRRMIVGPSLGGLISLYTGLNYPGVFGNIASQSASIWRNPGKIHDLMRSVASDSLKPKLFLQWGSFEQEGIVNFNMNAARDAEALGFDVKTRTIPALHNWLGWRNGLSEILRSTFTRELH